MRYCRCAAWLSRTRTECRIAARLSQPAAIFLRPSPRVLSAPRSTSGQSIAFAASAIPASARCCAGVAGPTGRWYSLRRPAASKLRNRITAFCNCTTAARFAMRRRARPFGGSRFRTSPASGKGNKGEALRLRSGDTGQMSSYVRNARTMGTCVPHKTRERAHAPRDASQVAGGDAPERGGHRVPAGIRARTGW